jgi:site-specific recombinase XerD
MQTDRYQDWLQYLKMDYQGSYKAASQELRLYYEYIKHEKIQSDDPLSDTLTVYLSIELMGSV